MINQGGVHGSRRDEGALSDGSAKCGVTAKDCGGAHDLVMHRRSIAAKSLDGDQALGYIDGTGVSLYLLGSFGTGASETQGLTWIASTFVVQVPSQTVA
ncbi:hypothetical protein NL676_038756 [Syzygium grande]|nr:hypothetical protein NL676_038756 [Syzygium grande]